MSKINDGGTAFPCEGGSHSQPNPDPGMSLRDYFAAKAIAGLIEGYDFEMRENSESKQRTGFDDEMNGLGSQNWAQSLATHVYLIADAMLAEKRN